MNNTPVWIPKNPQASHMWQFMRFVEQAHQQRLQEMTFQQELLQEEHKQALQEQVYHQRW